MIERYATASAWAEWFQNHDGVSVGESTIRKRLVEACVTGVPVGGAGKGVSKNVIFSEAGVRQACADLLAPLPVADKDGFITVGGIRHGTFRALERSMGISKPTISSIVRDSGMVSIHGKNGSGHVCDFYPEPGVYSVCADLMDPELPKCGNGGFVDVGGVRHGTAFSFVSILKISESTISSRLVTAGLTPIRGKDKMGRIANLYPEPEIRKLCADLLAPLPVADESGFVIFNGIRHGTKETWARELGMSPKAITSRLRFNSVQPMNGKALSGQIRNFYSEPEVRKICADLLAPLHVADKDGFIMVCGVHHGTIKLFSHLLGIAEGAIVRRLQEFIPVTNYGKDVHGVVRDYYPEPEVRKLCADLLAPLPVADKDGFIMVGDVRHGTVSAWSRELKISGRTICLRIRSATITSIQGKANGHLQGFYPEPVVRAACADLLRLVPIANEYGFFALDGIRYGTVHAWSQELRTNEKILSSRIGSATIAFLIGKRQGGRIFNFYPEPAIRELCRDLIERKKFNPKPR